MNELLTYKLKNKVNQIGLDNMKEFLRVLIVDVETFGGSLVDEFYLVRLKRLVDSYELVESYGGLEKAKLRCYPAKFINLDDYNRLKQAIQDVESCNVL